MMFYFYLNNHLTPPNKLAIDKKKFVLQYILTTSPHKRGSFALSVDVFKNIHQKMKSLNVYEM